MDIEDRRAGRGSAEGALAARPASLANKIGVLFDIAKPRGMDFLDRVEEVLRGRYRVRDVIRQRKRAFTKPAPRDLLEEMERRADFVILALADCGRCNTCIEYGAQSIAEDEDAGLHTCGLSTCVEEALFFEARGIPTTVVATAEYAKAARIQQVELGIPRCPMVTVPGSIQRLLKDEVRERADQAMEAIIAQLVTQEVAG